MKMTLWGARGSLPTPHSPVAVAERVRQGIEGFLAAGLNRPDQIAAYLASLPAHKLGGFGGNTPCVALQSASGQSQVMIDGGSGLRLVGYDLMKGPCGKGQGEAHIFFTHFHWDHLIGLPFFTPIFIPGNRIHVYAVQPELETVLRTVFRKPYFPLNFEQLGAKIEFHTLEPRKALRLGEFSLTPYQLDHPDPCWGYRVEADGKVYSHCVDTEGTRTTREELGADLPLYQGVDFMLYDAQYTLMEAIEKVNWGHAPATIGLDIAMREGIRKVLFMHHDPASSDEKIAAAEHQARRYYEAQLRTARRNGDEIHEVDWRFAREGDVVEL